MSSVRQEASSFNVSRLASLIVFVVLCFSAAGLGAFFPPDDWYASLNRPPFSPPNWVFGPVWTVLYSMIAAAGWLVWTCKASTARRLALMIFGIQLLLNAAWSAIFFGWHQPGWAFVEIVALWLSIATMIVLFKKQSMAAAALLIPYLTWVTFAAVLNYGFWASNT